MHAASQFSLSTVNASAESVNGSTPAARVTWSTTIPPQCVAALRVEFRTRITRSVVATYTTTNTSQTEVIQTGLQCAIYYYITVVVTGETSDGPRPTVTSRQFQLRLVGGRLCAWDSVTARNLMVSLSFCTDIPIPVGVRAEATADNTSIRVSWNWQGVPKCANNVTVHYQPEGGSPMMYTVSNTTATSATLPNLQCNTEYTIWVEARGGRTSKRSVSRMVSLPARGMYIVCNLSHSFLL